MKKVLLYLLLLLACIGTYFFVFKKEDKPFAEHQFNIKNPDDLSKIFIADMEGHTVLLTRKGQSWYFNDSVLANEARIKSLMMVLQEALPEQLASNELAENVFKNLATLGRKVELYDNDNKKIVAFTIGGALQDNVGNIGLKEGQKKPAIYKIPGHDADLFANFDLTPEEWVDKYFFRKNPTKISSVEVLYNQHPDSSFKLVRQGNAYQCISKRGTETISNQNGLAYYKLFEKLPCVGFLNRELNIDSIFTKGEPYGKIIVEEGATKDTIQLVYMRADKRTRSFKTVNGKDYNIEFFFAKRNETSVTMSTQILSNILSTPSLINLTK